MFHINDLKDMDDDEIMKTAESMGIKKQLHFLVMR